MNKITIIMYHYIRDLKNARFPEIKGLDVNLFVQQIEYLLKHYNVVSLDQLISALDGVSKLPDHAALLTFDDGYSDHYNVVFPILDHYGLTGVFFPSVRAIVENKVLDVNKIHFVLASTKNNKELIDDVYKELDVYRSEYGLFSNEAYFCKLAIANRFDSKEVVFIKRLLQVELNKVVRAKILDALFYKYVGVDEGVFSRELYMNTDQLRTMKKHGMSIGSHGFNHYWLKSMSVKEQEQDITKSLSFLKELGVNLDNWSMCYPYGSYNDDTLALLAKYNCNVAFTTEVQVADLNKSNRLLLPRLDTNDIPKDANLTPNRWYYYE